MAILGGMGSFWGPAVGAAGADPAEPADHLATPQYWPLVLGIVLIVLLFVFPGGIAGALARAAGRA